MWAMIFNACMIPLAAGVLHERGDRDARLPDQCLLAKSCCMVLVWCPLLLWLGLRFGLAGVHLPPAAAAAAMACSSITAPWIKELAPCPTSQSSQRPKR